MSGVLFDSRDFENKESIEVPWKKKNPNDFSIGDLMCNHISALFIKANVNSDLEKDAYKKIWIEMLNNDIDRIKNIEFKRSDNWQKLRILHDILYKIDEIEMYGMVKDGDVDG